uniref:alpha-1,3-mannosyl-glycoprotein 2-beta-N-acetylglucosaminyltransferase n=1 Tax=Arcella intermedia TaxID=1963864 RepID=A0A6B2L9N3_9EUKA
MNRSLEAVFKYKGEAPVDVIISQDDDEAPMTEYLSSLKGRYPISHIQHKDRIAPTIKQGELVGYYYISQHYKFALEHAFSQGYEFVIILEEDIEIAPDFFPYFFKLKEVLELDPTVFCISAWNDNGRPGLVSDAEQLYRTDFFPGLGWMMKRSFWEEVKNNWPAGYWDDWLREPQQRKGRVCIYPEVSRTYTFGLKDGTSQGQFADKYLKPIILNQVNVPWMQKDVSYLLKQNYDPIFLKFVKNAKPVAPEEISNFQDTDLLVEYKKGDHVRSCDTFEIMNDEKVGVLRTSYMDVVIFRRNSNRIFLAPTGFQNEISLK